MQAIHRLAATGAASVPLLHCSRLAASPAAAACHRCIGSAAIQASPAVCARDWPRTAPGRRHLPPAAAAYTVVTGSTGGGDGSSSGGSSSQQPAAALRLIVYSREGCHLCEGLKEKLEALLERAAFLPSPLSGAELEVRDITTNPDWEQRYALTIPVLAVVAGAVQGGGGGAGEEVTVPRPSPRFTADALQKHIERFLAAQQQQQQHQEQQQD